MRIRTACRSLAWALAISVAGAALGGCSTTISLLGDEEETPAEAPPPASTPATPAIRPKTETAEGGIFDPAPITNLASATFGMFFGETAELPDVAAVYADFTENVTELAEEKVSSTDEVARAVTRLRDWRPEELAESWTVHNAFIVARTQGFAEGVAAEAESEGREEFLQRIDMQPTFLRGLPGAARGLENVYADVRADMKALKEVGAMFRSISGGMRRASLELPGERGAAFSVVPAALQYGSGEAAAMSVQDRILALAARISLDAVSGDEEEKTRALIENKTVAQCLRFAKLNLTRCMSADPDVANTAQCVARHGTEEVAACLEWILPRTSS